MRRGAVVERAHAAGMLVMHQVGSAEEARRAVAGGVDVIVAQGFEAGGHVRGEAGVLPLVTAVVDAAGSVPIAAAGGIADGRGLAAVLALGADGVWVGTRFVAAEESEAHPDYEKRLVAARETDTVYTELFHIGWPEHSPRRVLRNALTGQTDLMANYAEQGVAAIREVLPAREIVERMVAGAHSARHDVRASEGEDRAVAFAEVQPAAMQQDPDRRRFADRTRCRPRSAGTPAATGKSEIFRQRSSGPLAK